MTTVARGDADVYVQAPGHTKMWDTCAPAALLLAAGGVVTDLRGHPLDFRAPSVTHPRGVVATPHDLHAPILARLAPLADKWL
jgi:3'(2'), 5'-bisphosphate nucleotidase